MRITKGLIIGSLLASAVFAPLPVYAQANMLEEILVTAQRRSQSVQDVAATVNAYSAEQLDRMRFDDVDDVALIVPNVDIKQAIAGTNSVITIRGVGLNDFSSNNTGSVGVYVDDVFLASTASLEFATFDTERLEVLKGPQGTLYGRNTTGGAVNIISRKPSQERGGYFSVGAGDYGLLEVEGAVTGPISDKTAYRLSGKFTEQGESYFTQLQTGEDFGDRTAYGLRGQIQHEGDVWNANLKVQISDDDGPATPYKLTGAQTLDSAPTAQFVASEFLAFPEFAPLLATDPAVGLGGVGQFCDAVLAGVISPSTCADLQGFQDLSSDPRTGAANFAGGNSSEIETFDATLTLSRDLTDSLSFTSITGFRSLERMFSEDVDGSAATLFEYRHDTEVDQFSQELRFNWVADGWDVVFGAFYSTDEVKHNFDNFADELFLTRLNIGYEQETVSAAGFVDATYEVSDKVSIKGGLRLTYEDKEYVGGTTDLNPFGISLLLLDPDTFEFFPGSLPLSFTDTSFDETDVSGRIGIDYRANENTLYYAQFSKGFKSGGVIGDITFSNEELTPFDPETVFSYEVGIKSEPSDSVRFNASLFYYDYENIQTFVAGSLGPVLGNADDAEVTGADIELVWQPTDQLAFNLGLGLLDTEVGNPFNGNKLPNAPETTATAQVTYGTQVSNGYNLLLQGGMKYSDEIERDIDNTPVTRSDSYTLFNARITLESIEAGWDFSLWAENLSDEDYAQQTFFLPTVGNVIQSFNAPRTWGVSARKEF